MLDIDMSRCTGCRRCETACAFFRTGKVSRHLARITVVNLYESGIDAPVVCVQCAERYCLVCPEDALTIGSLGQVIYSATACTLCGLCEQRCPIGAIKLTEHALIICDLCGGKPRCVEACTEGALTNRPSGNPVSLEKYTEMSKGKNPDQKRKIFVSGQGASLRIRWRDGH
jgi:Fe-S-cluster-containing hydrogenase component 2